MRWADSSWRREHHAIAVFAGRGAVRGDSEVCGGGRSDFWDLRGCNLTGIGSQEFGAGFARFAGHDGAAQRIWAADCQRGGVRAIEADERAAGDGFYSRADHRARWAGDGSARGIRGEARASAKRQHDGGDVSSGANGGPDGAPSFSEDGGRTLPKRSGSALNSDWQ